MPLKLETSTRRLAITIGAAIADARRVAALSQQRLADSVGMTRSNYARIEQGGTNVTIETLLRIAHGLGLEVEVRFIAPAVRSAEQRRRYAEIGEKYLSVADSTAPSVPRRRSPR